MQLRSFRSCCKQRRPMSVDGWRWPIVTKSSVSATSPWSCSQQGPSPRNQLLYDLNRSQEADEAYDAALALAAASDDEDLAKVMQHERKVRP